MSSNSRQVLPNVRKCSPHPLHSNCKKGRKEVRIQNTQDLPPVGRQKTHVTHNPHCLNIKE